jgi:hypothetical protein
MLVRIILSCAYNYLQSVFQFNLDRTEYQAKLAVGIGSTATWWHETYGKASQYLTLFGTKGLVPPNDKKITFGKGIKLLSSKKLDVDDVDDEDFEEIERQPSTSTGTSGTSRRVAKRLTPSSADDSTSAAKKPRLQQPETSASTSGTTRRSARSADVKPKAAKRDAKKEPKK